jgi:hypothetical protein
VIENFVALLLCRSVLLRTLRSNSQSAVLVWIPSLEFPRAHQFHLLTRDRSDGTLKYKPTRAGQKHSFVLLQSRLAERVHDLLSDGAMTLTPDEAVYAIFTALRPTTTANRSTSLRRAFRRNTKRSAKRY